MRQRLLVMNGQKITQAEQGGVWKSEKVEKAGAIKPGIYNLFSAQKADKSQQYDGAVVHIDEGSVYQQVGKKMIMHDKSGFDIVPEAGSVKSISYGAQGKAEAGEVLKANRSRSR